MALSRTEIANRALDAIGADSIGSINDSTKPAQLCNRLFTPLRDGLLRRHPWNFATARATLPVLATAPAWGFAYAYQLPYDYQRIVRLNVTDPTTPYKIEAGTIVTDAGAPLGILYVQSVDDTGRFDPLFTDALVLALARDLAKPIANDTTLRAQLAKDFADAVRDARSADAAEGTPDDLWSDTLIYARL
jgi:hypothetical protein